MVLEEVKKKLPKTAMITKAYFEGSDIVFYTKNKRFFLEGGEEVKQLVRELRKRIEIRPDPEIAIEQKKAEEEIKRIVSKEAGIKKILFEPEFSKVTIYASKPGVVIGKAGETLKKIKNETLWSPQIMRVPLIKSDIVSKAREIVHEEAKYRQQFLNRIGEKIRLSKGSKEGWVRLSSLGGFREVGRSCLLLQTKESRVLLDCGLSFSSGGEMPFLDIPEFDLDALDAVIVSHAHMDHVGFVPYLYEYGYKGPFYSTAPTRDLATLLCLDYIDIAQKDTGASAYTSKGIKSAIKHSITLNYDEVCDITPDMRLTFQNAGHILGSAVSHLHIGEGLHNLLYTGDIKFGRTRLLDSASTNFQRIESLVMESTYGGQTDVIPSKTDCEGRLTEIIKKTLKRKGKVIIPSFAVGRAQELMILLADMAEKNELEANVYLDGMIWKATAIHTTYPEFLSRDLQKQIFHQLNNPFASKIFRNVGSPTERKKVIDEKEPSVIITTSGMINGGPIMEYLRYLADDKKNTLVFVGYQAEGTLGRRIQKGWKDLSFPTTADDRRSRVSINMDVETVHGLSGHSDRNQLINYFCKLRSRPEKVILNHGENSKILNLTKTLHRLFKVETLAPRNLEAVRLR